LSCGVPTVAAMSWGSRSVIASALSVVFGGSVDVDPHLTLPLNALLLDHSHRGPARPRRSQCPSRKPKTHISVSRSGGHVIDVDHFFLRGASRRNLTIRKLLPTENLTFKKKSGKRKPVRIPRGKRVRNHSQRGSSISQCDDLRCGRTQACTLLMPDRDW
jgi:hypothetical protein